MQNKTYRMTEIKRRERTTERKQARRIKQQVNTTPPTMMLAK